MTQKSSRSTQTQRIVRAANRLARGPAGYHVAGATVGMMAELFRPGFMSSHTAAWLKRAAELGLPDVAQALSTRTGHVAGAALRGIGIAGMAYEMVNTYKNTRTDFGSKLAQLGAVMLANGLGYLPIAGPVVIVADVVTGGAVTASFKGVVALGDALLTGDEDALNQWVKNSHTDTNGWLLEKLARNPGLAHFVSEHVESWLHDAAEARTVLTQFALDR